MSKCFLVAPDFFLGERVLGIVWHWVFSCPTIQLSSYLFIFCCLRCPKRLTVCLFGLLFFKTSLLRVRRVFNQHQLSLNIGSKFMTQNLRNCSTDFMLQSWTFICRNPKIYTKRPGCQPEDPPKLLGGWTAVQSHGELRASQPGTKRRCIGRCRVDGW